MHRGTNASRGRGPTSMKDARVETLFGVRAPRRESCGTARRIAAPSSEAATGGPQTERARPPRAHPSFRRMAFDPGGGLAQIPQPRRAFLARAIRSSPQIEAAGQLPLSLPTPSHCRHGTRYLYWRPKFEGTHSNALPWMPAEEG